MLAILCPSGDDDLNRLLGIRPWLHDARVNLIPPDERARTVSEGHALRPRFVGYADGDFSNVAAVVEKMTGPAHADRRQRRAAGELGGPL